jgi:MFS family permease
VSDGTTWRSGTRQLWLAFPTALRFLFLGDLVTAFGIGLTQPYLVILLHLVKGLPLVTATGLTSLLAVASVPGNWLSGSLADRIGGYRTMTLGLFISAGGLLAVSAGSGAVLLGASVATIGFGWSLTLPAYSTLIGGLAPEEVRGRAFTAQYALFNVGSGAGAAAGAVTVRNGVTGTLAVLWGVAAATCLVAIVLVQLARKRAPARSGAAEERASGGYRAVLADRALRPVLVATLLFTTAGYGVYNAGLPVLAVLSGVPGSVGVANVANCLTVVAGLPFALALATRLRPAQLAAVTTLLWSSGWALCAVAAHSSALSGTSVLVVAAIVMGLGEITLSGVLPALINALAPEALRGRYNAVLTLATTAGLWLGPVLTAGATALGNVSLLFSGAIAMLVVAPMLTRGPAAARPLAEVAP